MVQRMNNESKILEAKFVDKESVSKNLKKKTAEIKEVKSGQEQVEAVVAKLMSKVAKLEKALAKKEPEAKPNNAIEQPVSNSDDSEEL